MAGLPWRIALVVAAAVAGQQFATHTGLLDPWLAGLAIAATAA
jgi:hypothetical protein